MDILSLSSLTHSNLINRGKTNAGPPGRPLKVSNCTSSNNDFSKTYIVLLHGQVPLRLPIPTQPLPELGSSRFGVHRVLELLRTRVEELDFLLFRPRHVETATMRGVGGERNKGWCQKKGGRGCELRKRLASLGSCGACLGA